MYKFQIIQHIAIFSRLINSSVQTVFTMNNVYVYHFITFGDNEYNTLRTFVVIGNVSMVR